MATVQITVAGVDITASVVFATAEFDSAVNGTVGSCKFRIRDEDRTMTLVAGSEIALLIDGDPAWTGYLVKQDRVYAFPAENVVDAGLARWFDVTGVDLNTLFNKRIVYDKADPTIVAGTLFPAHTADDTAIAELVTNWLDLSGDGLDVSTHVENVADINVDQTARAWSGSYSWGQAMMSIAELPAAVYFLDPARNLVYTDVNTASAPFGLSDQPDGVTTVGYREMTLTADGTGLVNDELAWGLGYGSQNPVFDRETDAASVALHGLWQGGTLASGVYKAATIDRIAQSVVYGSPSSQRGAKDDKTAVVVMTYVPGFLPAQKVDFTSVAFGFEDVIPIRKMRITFDAPDIPKYELTLSHAIDSPWGFIDQFIPTFSVHFRLPKLKLPWIPPFPSAPFCNWEDLFDRTVSGEDWGNSGSPSGQPLLWAATYPSDGAEPTASVSAGEASLGLLVGGLNQWYTNEQVLFFASGTTNPLFPTWTTAGFEVTGSVEMDHVGTFDATAETFFVFGPASRLVIGFVWGASSVSIATAYGGGGHGAGTVPIVGSLNLNTSYSFRVRCDGIGADGTVYAKVWPSSIPEPVAWITNFPGCPDQLDDLKVQHQAYKPDVTPPNIDGQTDYTTVLGPIRIESLDTYCQGQFAGILDDFQGRTLSGSWGTPHPLGSPDWVVASDNPGGGTSSLGVSGGLGIHGSSIDVGGDGTSVVSSWNDQTTLTVVDLAYNQGGASVDLAIGGVEDPPTYASLITDGEMSTGLTLVGSVSSEQAELDVIRVFGTDVTNANLGFSHEAYDGMVVGVTDSLISADPSTPGGLWAYFVRVGTYVGASMPVSVYRDQVLQQTTFTTPMTGPITLPWTSSPSAPNESMTIVCDSEDRTEWDVSSLPGGVFPPGTTRTSQVTYDNVASTSSVVVASTAAFSPFGQVCEQAARTSTTRYAVSVNFVPNSTQVWRNGIFQRLGTDYIELVDGYSVSFVDPVSDGETIRVCYYAANQT